MHNFGVSAILLLSYAYYACIGWRQLAAAALLTPSTAAQLERVHRRTRQLSPLLRRHLRTAETISSDVDAVAAGDVSDELRLAAELAQPGADAAKSYHNDYDRLLEVILDEVLFIHSRHKKVVRTSACAEVVDDQALLLRTVARSTKSLVGMQIGSRTAISYCEPAVGEANTDAPSTRQRSVGELEGVSNNERLALVRLLFGARSTPRATEQCALDAKCATIYRWKPVKINRTGNDNGTTEEALVPSGCTCVINAANAGLSDTPVIVF